MTRRRRGRPTQYPHKVVTMPYYLALSYDARSLLCSVAAHKGWSLNDVITKLILDVDQNDAEDCVGPVEGQVPHGVWRIVLPVEALDRLEWLREVTGASVTEIVESLAHEYVAYVFPECRVVAARSDGGDDDYAVKGGPR